MTHHTVRNSCDSVAVFTVCACDTLRMSMRQRLLREALGQVNRFGWTREAIEAAGKLLCRWRKRTHASLTLCAVRALSAERVGLPRTAHGIVSGGETELVSFFVRQCNSELGAAVGPIGELTVSTARIRAQSKR